MTSRLSASLALALAAGLSHADDIPLADRLARLEAIVDRDRVDQGIPGAALGVIMDGEVVLARGLGVANVKTQAAVTPDTIFPIGSATKSFTSVLGAMIEDDGLVSLDAPILEHVDGVVIGNGIKPTIRDALSHRSGLGRMPVLGSCTHLSPDDIVEYVQRAELAVPYRTTFSYSNVNYTLAGAAIARAADSNWHDLVHSRIISPLGMTRTTTTLAARDAMDNVAEGYEPLDDDEPEREESIDWNLSSIAAAGAINSSINDMLIWTKFLLDDGLIGNVDELDDGSLEDLWQPRVAAGPTQGYGTGFFVEQRGELQLAHHRGNVPGFGTQVVLVPEHDAAIVLLTNEMIHPLQSTVISHAVDCLFGDELPPLESAASGVYPEDLTRYEGRYRFTQGNMDMTAAAIDGKLFLDVPGQTNYELLAPDADGKWYFALTDEIAVTFADGGDEAATMTMFQAGLEFEMKRKVIELDPSLPTLDDLLPPIAPTTLVMAGEINFANQGILADYTVIADGVTRARDETNMPGLGTAVNVINGTRGWVNDISGHVVDIDADDVTSYLSFSIGAILGQWRDIYASLTVISTENVKGEAGIRIECTRASGESDTIVLAHDGRILASKIAFDAGAMGSMNIETTYGDWADVNGRMVPHTASSNMMGVGRIDYEFFSIKTGVTVSDDAFASLEKDAEDG